jgi:hypothetical protein
MKRLIPVLILISMVGCSPKVTTRLATNAAPLDYKQEVFVIGLTEEAPADAVELGTVKIGDNGFSTNCGWDVVIEQAKMEARKAGGNVLKITSHIPPNGMGSSCDRIRAKILKVENPDELIRFAAAKTATIDSTWDYAMLYVYRPGGAGAFVGYDLYLNDSVIGRVRNNSKQVIKITKKGMNTLWAKTESKTEVPVDFEFGREYYLSCGIQMGIMVGRPAMRLVENTKGRAQYNSIKSK